MDSRLTAVMSQMSPINLIEPRVGGSPRFASDELTFHFFSLKIQTTVYMRIANLSRLDNWVTLAGETIFRAFYLIFPVHNTVYRPDIKKPIEHTIFFLNCLT